MIINFTTVRPGSVLDIYLDSFTGSTGASATLSGLAVGDIKIFKNGGATARASTNGFTLIDTDGIDIASITGLNGFSIDLADNSDAGFYVSGGRYVVVLSSVTIDSQTVNVIVAHFHIGYPDALFNTTIATLASQTSMTLTAGPAEDDALNGMWAVIHDIASGVQRAVVQIDDYVGSTKTITLASGATFTAAAGDNISIMSPMPIQPTAVGRKLDVTAAGNAGIDWANVEAPSSSVNLSATTVKDAADVTSTLLGIDGNIQSIDSRIPAALVGGRMDASIGAVAAGVIAAASFAAGALDAVWSVASRLLTAGTNIVLAKGTGITGFNDLSAAQVNAEADTALADYDPPTKAELDTAQTAIQARLPAALTVDGNIKADTLRVGGTLQTAGDIIGNLTTLLSRIPAALFAGITSLAQWLGLIAGKQAGDSTARTELRATGAGSGTFDETTDSQEAIRDNMSSGGLSAQDVRDAMKLAPTAGVPAAGSVDLHLDEIQAKTDGLPADPADASVIAGLIGVLDAKLPAALTGAGNMKADMLAINGSTAAATRQALAAAQMIPFTVTTAGFAPTTTQFEASDITEATADHYNGAVVIWTSGALAGQRTAVSDYALASGRGHFTVVAMTEAPANGDTGILV